MQFPNRAAIHLTVIHRLRPQPASDLHLARATPGSFRQIGFYPQVRGPMVPFDAKAAMCGAIYVSRPALKQKPAAIPLVNLRALAREIAVATKSDQIPRTDPNGGLLKAQQSKRKFRLIADSSVSGIQAVLQWLMLNPTAVSTRPYLTLLPVVTPFPTSTSCGRNPEQWRRSSLRPVVRDFRAVVADRQASSPTANGSTAASAPIRYR